MEKAMSQAEKRYLDAVPRELTRLAVTFCCKYGDKVSRPEFDDYVSGFETYAKDNFDILRDLYSCTDPIIYMESHFWHYVEARRHKVDYGDLVSCSRTVSRKFAYLAAYALRQRGESNGS